MKEFVYQLACIISFLLGHAAPPDRESLFVKRIESEMK